MTLPDLPKAERIEAVQFCDDAYWFSAEQMREYGRQARNAALEEAAEACVPKDLLSTQILTHSHLAARSWCAAQIRKLKEKS